MILFIIKALRISDNELLDDFNRYRIGDATVCIAIVILAFILPAKLNFWCFSKAGPDEEVRPSPALLDWNYVQQKFPWNVLLLLGGGYAISDASKVSGLSLWMGSQLSVLGALPPIAVMILMCLLASLITEVASNTATASILLPIVAQMVMFTFHQVDVMMESLTLFCWIVGCGHKAEPTLPHDPSHNHLLLCFHAACWHTLQCHGLLSGETQVT